MLKTLAGACVGEFIKLGYRIYTPDFKPINRQRKVGEERVIVSLTFYGRRVNDVLAFSIYSLLSQTYRPDEIVLWLDSDNWSKKNFLNVWLNLSRKVFL